MQRQLVTILVASVVLAAGVTAWPAQAQTGACQLAPVFAMLREVVGRERVGECTGTPARTESGDLNQSTTRGTLTLRANDLVPAFSDGQTTWLFGPRGLESRPSNTQLAWETVAAMPPGGPAPGNSATGLAPASSSVSSAAPDSAAPQTGIAPQPVAPAVASPAPAPVLPIAFDGDDATTTRPFDLAGGNYVVAWELELRRGTTSCYLGSRLRRFDDQNPGSLILHTTLNTSNDRSSAGETRIFNVPPGRYVMDVSTTGCDWKIELRAPN